MRITKDDVGRKVVDGLDNIKTIIEFIEGEEYPVVTTEDTGAMSYTEDGVFSLDCPNAMINLVKFLDEEEEDYDEYR